MLFRRRAGATVKGRHLRTPTQVPGSEPVAASEPVPASEPVAAGPPPRRRSRRYLLLPVTATLLHIGVMLVFTLLYPPYWSFDEKEQVARVLTTQLGDIRPVPGQMAVADGVAATWQRFYLPEPPPFMRETPQDRALRPTFDSLGGGHLSGKPVILLNQMSEHPPGFFLLGAGVLDAIPGESHLAWDRTVAILRLLSVALIAPLPLLCWGAARRFTRESIAGAAAFAPLLVPAFERLGASVNNDNLLICSTSVLLYLLARVMHGDLRMRTAVAVAVALLVALLTKGFALVLPPVIAVAYLAAWRRSRGPFPWWPALILVISGVVGGAWWLRNLLDFGAVQPSGLPPAAVAQSYPSLPAGQHGSYGDYVHTAASGLVQQFWGALGVPLPPQIPGPVCVGATIFMLALALAGFVLARGQRAGLVVMVLVPVLVVLMASPSSAHDFHRTGQLIGLQGRYLYEGFVGLVVVAAVGLDRLIALIGRRRAAAANVLSRSTAPVTLVLAFAVEALAGFEVTRNWWLPPGEGFRHSGFDLLRAIGRYAAWPRVVTGSMVAFAGATAILAVVAVWLVARRSDADPDPVVTG